VADALYNIATTYSIESGVLTDGSGAVPSGTIVAGIGSSNGGGFLNGYLRRLVYFPTRITDAQLQALVA